MIKLFKRWGHGLLILYIFIYLPIFAYLEANIKNFHSIHSPLDNYIPFCEYFVIPYFMWFVLIAVACAYFFFRSQAECIRFGLFLIAGMSLALVIYVVYPNGLVDFRPTSFPRDNIFTDWVKFLYSVDTSTNVLPSLHVYNTLVCVTAVFKSRTFGKYHKIVNICVGIVGFFICLSTVFLKQHSIYDVLAAMVMAGVIYPLIYKTKALNSFKSDIA